VSLEISKQIFSGPFISKNNKTRTNQYRNGLGPVSKKRKIDATNVFACVKREHRSCPNPHHSLLQHHLVNKGSSSAPCNQPVPIATIN
jgi:hypothetical protein